MTPTIRIPDETYSRLQALAVPFVDTPARVIERVLDVYEDLYEVMGWDDHDERNILMTPELEAPLNKHRAEINEYGKTLRKPLAKDQHRGPKLFLAPASGPNVDQSLRQWVHLRDVEHLLTPKKVEQLKDALAGEIKFKCWAMTAKRRSVWSPMRPGDFVLFSEKGSGTFGLKGRILTKLESTDMGNALWPVPPGGRGSWGLIYLLRDVESANISKERMLGALGYDSSYWLPGVIRVGAERLGPAVARYGGDLEKMLQHLDESER